MLRLKRLAIPGNWQTSRPSGLVYLFFILGALPLGAQDAVQNGGKLGPDQVPDVAPAKQPGAVMLQPSVTAPPPGAPQVLPQRPAEPVVIPKLDVFTVAPGTIRQIAVGKTKLTTTVQLTAPALKDFHCHIASSDPKKAECDDIVFFKGQTQSTGNVNIYWKNIARDCKVEFKASEQDHPEIVLQTRLYIRKALP